MRTCNVLCNNIQRGGMGFSKKGYSFIRFILLFSVIVLESSYGHDEISVNHVKYAGTFLVTSYINIIWRHWDSWYSWLRVTYPRTLYDPTVFHSGRILPIGVPLWIHFGIFGIYFVLVSISCSCHFDIQKSFDVEYSTESKT